MSNYHEKVKRFIFGTPETGRRTPADISRMTGVAKSTVAEWYHKPHRIPGWVVALVYEYSSEAQRRLLA